MSGPTISAVVPVLDEEDRIESLLRSVRSEGIGEVIVVDGGSRDRSVERAGRHADHVVHENGGLARQLNRGAELARGEILFFLHADSELPPGAADAITASLSDAARVGGAFRLRLDARHTASRVVAWGANLRTRLGLGPFGDQGIFVRRDAFSSVGGYCEQTLLEDFDLVRRLRQNGSMPVLRLAITTSARRWESHGWWSTSLRNGWTLARYLAGDGPNPAVHESYARWRSGGRASRSHPDGAAEDRPRRR